MGLSRHLLPSYMSVTPLLQPGVDALRISRSLVAKCRTQLSPGKQSRPAILSAAQMVGGVYIQACLLESFFL